MRFIDKLLNDGKVIGETPKFISDNGNECFMQEIEYTNGVRFVVYFMDGEPFEWHGTNWS